MYIYNSYSLIAISFENTVRYTAKLVACSWTEAVMQKVHKKHWILVKPNLRFTLAARSCARVSVCARVCARMCVHAHVCVNVCVCRFHYPLSLRLLYLVSFGRTYVWVFACLEECVCISVCEWVCVCVCVWVNVWAQHTVGRSQMKLRIEWVSSASKRTSKWPSSRRINFMSFLPFFLGVNLAVIFGKYFQISFQK